MEHGKIEMDDAEILLKYIDEQKEKEQYELIKRRFQDVHSAPITKDKKTGRWFTRVSNPNGGKQRQIGKNSLDKLEIELAKHYFGKLPSEDGAFKYASIKSLYPMFLEKQRKKGRAESTFKQYESYWRTYYENEPFVGKLIQDVTTNELEDWALNLLADYSITKQTYINIVGVLNNIMRIALKGRIIDNNPFDAVDVVDLDKYETERKNKLLSSANEDCLDVSENEGDSLSYDEVIPYTDTAWELFKKEHIYKNVLVFLAFLFMLQTALRPSEILALKYSDIHGNQLIVQRMFADQGPKYREIKHYTKSHKRYRKMPLSTEALRILRIAKETQTRLYGDSEFVFSNSNAPMTYEVLKRSMRILCREAKIDRHRPYACRKTCITALVDSKMYTVAEIAEMCGNSVKVIYDTYYKNRNKRDYPTDYLDKSLIGIYVRKPEQLS